MGDMTDSRAEIDCSFLNSFLMFNSGKKQSNKRQHEMKEEKIFVEK